MSRPVAVRQWPANCGPKAIFPPPPPSPSMASGNSSGGYVVLSDDESSDDRPMKKCKVEPGTTTTGIPDDDDLEKLEAEDIDGYVQPDEKWMPEPGAITMYQNVDIDWVDVSSSRNFRNAAALHVKPLQQVNYSRSSSSLQMVAFSELDLEEEFQDITPITPQEELDDHTAAELVPKLLQTYEKVRLKTQQNAEISGTRCNAYMKAWTEMKARNSIINTRKRIGHVPGVEVGQAFVFRFEMMVVGLHHSAISGISTIPAAENQYGEPLACSIVLSGGYEDDIDDGDTFTYVGQGGRDAKTGTHIADQKLEKGNLALANSCKYNLPVRVTRGNTEDTPSGKIYSYDGLYRILRYWNEKGIGGFTVFKYFLERLPHQKELGSRLVQFAGKLRSKQMPRNNVVCQDISGGLEHIPIVAVNDVDDPPLPPGGYTYVNKLIFPKGFQKPKPPSGCKCEGHCGSAEGCRCIRKNNGRLPYNKDGTLPEWKTVIYECGPNCGCPASCPNRVSQRRQQHKFEVFRTPNRGWGVRAWEPISYGSFICEYVGEMITSEEAERRVGNDEYIFDIDCIRGSKNRGVDVSCFFEEATGGELAEQVENTMSIDAVHYGNFTRFINHSCEPNIFVQCVFYDHTDFKVPHIMMFASRHIRPFEELAYDYSYAIDSVTDPVTGAIKKKACLCGANNCRKRLY